MHIAASRHSRESTPAGFSLGPVEFSFSEIVTATVEVSVGHPQQAKTIAELMLLSDDELIGQHDALSRNTNVGISYYLDELARRRADRQSRLMLRLTWLIAVLTVVNVIAVVASLVN